MPAWLLRGVCMGVLHAIGVTAVAKLNATGSSGIWPGKIVPIALLVGAAAAWAAVDGWLLRRDRGRDWFVAGLITGPLAGVLGVVGRAVVDQTGIDALSDALTGGAAFTALLVIVPAGAGLFVGSRLLGSSRAPDADEDDHEPPEPRRRTRSAVTGRRRRRGTITARKRAAQPAPPTPAPRARS